MILSIALFLASLGDGHEERAAAWAKKAKPIATCADEAACRVKWARAVDWVKSNSRFTSTVDQPNLYATSGAIAYNTDLSYVLVMRPAKSGGFEIAARAWCGNFISCMPKPKTVLAELATATNAD